MNESAQDWERIEPALDRAMDLLGAEREAFLLELAKTQPEVHARVIELLRAAGMSGSLLIDQPLAEAAGDLVERVPLDHWDAGIAAGDLVGSYRIVRPVGGGGMGHVFVAESTAVDGEQVALKVLSRSRDKEEMRRRFQRERQILASFDHPLIVPLIDDGLTRDGRPYFAMRLLDGISLTKYCKRNKLGIEERLRLFLELCDAVAYAHARGVIHRDLKPSNVLVEADGSGGVHPYVLDFGIAHEGEARDLTLTGQIMGTPGYMSPEQARGEIDRIDRRSDIFSLGALLYELLSGKKAYRGKNPAETLIAVVEQEPPVLRDQAPDLPQDLDYVVSRCLRRDRAERYESIAALVGDLEAYLAGVPLPSRRRGNTGELAAAAVGRDHRSGSWLGRLVAQRFGWAVAVLSAILVLVLALLARSLLSGEPKPLAEVEVVAGRSSADMADEVVARLRFAHLAQLHDLRAIHAQTSALRQELMARTETARTGTGALPGAGGSTTVSEDLAALGRVEWSRREVDAAVRWFALSEGSGTGASRTARQSVDAAAASAQHCLDLVEMARWFADDANRWPLDAALRSSVVRANVAVFDECRGRVGVLLADAGEVHDPVLRGELEMHRAFWADELAAASNAARALAQSQPWLFEAQLSLGTFFLLHAEGLAAPVATEEGSSRSAILEEATIAFERAVQQGRSDPLAHQRLCQAYLWRYEASGEAQWLERARRACQASRAADVNRMWPALLLGRIEALRAAGAEPAATADAPAGDGCGPGVEWTRPAAQFAAHSPAPQLQMASLCQGWPSPRPSGEPPPGLSDRSKRSLEVALQRLEEQRAWQGTSLLSVVEVLLGEAGE